MSEQEVIQNGQPSEQPKKEMKFGVDKIILAASLIGFVVVSALWANDKGLFSKLGSVVPSVGVSKDAVKIDLYVMSKCPYGVQAEDGLKPAYDKLKNNINLSINYIADEDGKGGFTSLHGETEVQGNIVQLCAKKYDADKYFDLIACQNKDYSNIPANWESCAKEIKLANIDKVKTCYAGEEGKNLLRENIKLAKAAQVSGSPTYYIAGTQYQGSRDEGAIIKEVCKNNPKIASCKDTSACFADTDCNSDVAKVGKCINPGAKNAKCDYVAANPVSLTVLNDKRCPDCGSMEAQITDSLKQIFKGLNVKSIDYSDVGGKDLFNTISTDGSQVKLDTLPAYLFSDDIKNGEGYTSVEKYLYPTKDSKYQVLAVGSQFDPTKEICDNNADDNKNGKIDCADSDCAGSTVCRKEVSKRLDVFVMSDCPYGNQAELAMKEVVANFGKNIDFHVNYIASKNSDGTFNSLHGEYEAQQDKVELCVNKYAPVKNLEFMNCMNEKGIKATKWQDCASQVGIAQKLVNSVNTCSTGSEGTYLLEQNIKIAETLGVGASPTWLVNNKYQGSALDPESIKTLFCQYNPGTAGCEKTLTGNAQASTAANAGAGCAVPQ